MSLTRCFLGLAELYQSENEVVVSIEVHIVLEMNIERYRSRTTEYSCISCVVDECIDLEGFGAGGRGRLGRGNCYQPVRKILKG